MSRRGKEEVHREEQVRWDGKGGRATGEQSAGSSCWAGEGWTGRLTCRKQVTNEVC
jgi:hypothetical protein